MKPVKSSALHKISLDCHWLTSDPEREKGEERERGGEGEGGGEGSHLGKDRRGEEAR